MARVLSFAGPLLDWMRSEGGRNFILVGTSVLSGVTAISYFLPNAPLIDKAKDIMQMYNEGIPVRPPQHLIQLISETLGDCGLAAVDAARIRWFVNFGFEPYHFGQAGFRKGAIIGLPKPYFYQSVDEIDRSQIKMARNKTLPWSSEAGTALKQALVLSDEAKRFVVAREIHEVSNSEVYLKTCTLMLLLPGITLAAVHFNDYVRLQKRARYIRFLANSAWTMAAVGAAVGVFDFITRYYESDADEEVAKMGEDYARGGVEFYGKSLLRNRALRELLGREGERSYTVEGDVIRWVRFPHVRYTKRRADCQAELDKYVDKRLHPEKYPAKEASRQDVARENAIKRYSTNYPGPVLKSESATEGKEVILVPDSDGQYVKAVVEKP